ncbi:VWA domain-containing protein [Roseovarius spongiae]|uniref:VWA domain-containing protein n=1 Tax=Roseovarius spongiae TaxID=2320272 RepID=A0A3A8AXB2_9RHOB|nr:VWA domain-containing protein [Roseovarius spongiae]RKF14691.1 VWA domain-containing protein [Roseovarius spongiae]
MKRLAALFAACASLAAPAAFAEEDVMIVFDGSNSMWGQIDGAAKIEIARGVMKNLLGDWTAERKVGLMAYGHRRRGDCADIETLIAPAAGTAADIQARIDKITPTGKTPLTDAVEMAAKQMAYTDRPATVVLISDGLESCERDPCALAGELAKSGVGFTAHVVGFGLGTSEDTASLACIAEETGGKFIEAGNASELGEALSTLGDTVAEAPAPEPAAEPEPEPEPQAPQIAVTAPATALAGSDFKVAWDRAPHPRDYITIVPAGADEGVYTHYIRVKDDSEGMLRALGDAGLYEVRYVQQETKKTLGSSAIELLEPEVTVSGPESALTGSVVGVSWSGNVNARDFVTIVPMGADEGASADYIRVKDDSEGKLQMPAETGMYELRYVLDEGRRTLASQPIEITAPEVTVSGPESALTGSVVSVSWSGNVNGRDFVTIVPMGADEGASADYIRVKDESEGKLQMPAETGMYELRYVLDKGRRTLASQPIEITAPEVTVSGPESALTGSVVSVSWSGNVNGRDFVTIVPMGADEGASADYIRVKDDSEGKLQMPAETGMYELRYVLDKGRRTLASQPIEITAPEVTVSGPESALTGSVVGVSWSGIVNGRDFVTIVPMGADEGASADYIRVKDDSEGKLQMPAETGMYELRYVLDKGRRTLASQPIEITAPEVTVSGPTEIRAGDRLRFSWTGAVNPRDFVRIAPMGSDDSVSGDYARVGDASEAELTAPKQTGVYELRYTLDKGRRVLARHRFEVLAADAALTTGAELSAPDAAAPGSTIEVGWTVESESADQRITLARGDQAIFTWITAIRIEGEPPVRMPLPEEPGSYELRFLDLSGQEVLARKVIVVE